VKLEDKILESVAHAASNPEDVNWISEDLEAFIIGKYIESAELSDISMFLDKVANNDIDTFTQIEADNLSKRIRRDVIKSQFKGDHEAMVKAMEAISE